MGTPMMAFRVRQWDQAATARFRLPPLTAGLSHECLITVRRFSDKTHVAPLRFEQACRCKSMLAKENDAACERCDLLDSRIPAAST